MSWLTRRIPTILGILLLLGIAGLGVWWIAQKNGVKEEVVAPEKVQITNIQDNKFSVSWTTRESSKGRLVWGKVGEKLERTAEDERGEGEYLVHQVTVEGLQPDTQYSFRILSGNGETTFDNKGTPYSVITGPTIAGTPPSNNLYGKVKLPTGQTPEAVVYLALPGGSVASTLATRDGNYTFTLSTIRTTDLKSYLSLDPQTTVANITVVDGKSKDTTAVVTIANSAPVPMITMGTNADFVAVVPPEEKPIVAEVKEEPVKPEIFNVEPLNNANEINAVETQEVKILNPATEGEVLAALKPEFRGSGPRGSILSIAIKGKTVLSEVVEIGLDGTWSYAPETNMKVGNHTITVEYISSGGIQKKVERQFVITDPGTSESAAFVATPSASKKASPSPSASPSPREAMPATDSGVPVTGVIENTVIVFGVGILLIIAGLILI